MFIIPKFFSTIKTLIKTKKLMEPTYNLKKLQVKDIIDLTANEKDLFCLFTTFVQEENLNSILRVAGGWVRDKVFFLLKLKRKKTFLFYLI